MTTHVGDHHVPDTELRGGMCGFECPLGQVDGSFAMLRQASYQSPTPSRAMTLVRGTRTQALPVLRYAVFPGREYELASIHVVSLGANPIPVLVGAFTRSQFKANTIARKHRIHRITGAAALHPRHAMLRLQQHAVKTASPGPHPGRASTRALRRAGATRRASLSRQDCGAGYILGQTEPPRALHWEVSSHQ